MLHSGEAIQPLGGWLRLASPLLGSENLGVASLFQTLGKGAVVLLLKATCHRPHRSLRQSLSCKNFLLTLVYSCGIILHELPKHSLLPLPANPPSTSFQSLANSSVFLPTLQLSCFVHLHALCALSPALSLRKNHASPIHATPSTLFSKNHPGGIHLLRRLSAFLRFLCVSALEFLFPSSRAPGPLVSSVCRHFARGDFYIPNPLNALPPLQQKQPGWGVLLLTSILRSRQIAASGYH